MASKNLIVHGTRDGQAHVMKVRIVNVKSSVDIHAHLAKQGITNITQLEEVGTSDKPIRSLAEMREPFRMPRTVQERDAHAQELTEAKGKTASKTSSEGVREASDSSAKGLAETGQQTSDGTGQEQGEKQTGRTSEKGNRKV